MEQVRLLPLGASFFHFIAIYRADNDNSLLIKLELYKTLQSHESDCFKRATIKLFDGCTSMDFDSKQNMECKIQASSQKEYIILLTRFLVDAIMLTMCQLTSAGVKIPKVCAAPFSTDYNKRNAEISNCVKYVTFCQQILIDQMSVANYWYIVQEASKSTTGMDNIQR